MISISIGFGNWKLNLLVAIIAFSVYVWYKRQQSVEEVDELERVSKTWILIRSR